MFPDVDVADKGVQVTMVNLFKEQQEIMFKELEENMLTNQQIENLSNKKYKL